MWRAIWSALTLLLIGITLAALLLPAENSARLSNRNLAEDNSPKLAFSAQQPAKAAIGNAASESAVTDLKQESDQPTPDGLQRKIIYSASVDLVVEDFSGVQEKVAALVKQYDAYVADSSLTGSTGELRRGNWKIRVPIANFDKFVAAAKGLGELVSASTTSKDVSEEYYDVDARIRNKTKEEERLLKLLEERPGKLEDVIAVERELARVREELERMQGRLRVMENLTSLTTAELTVTEIHNYQPEDAPNLPTRIHRAFDNSVQAISATGANMIIVGAFVAPWLPIVVVVPFMIYLMIRIWRRTTHNSDAAQK